MIKLLQTITKWTVTPDGNGGNTFSAPALVQGHWEDRQELLRDKKGEELTSLAIIYLSADVALGDYLALGDQTATADPIDLTDAEQVRIFNKTPGIRVNDYERKAIL